MKTLLVMAMLGSTLLGLTAQNVVPPTLAPPIPLPPPPPPPPTENPDFVRFSIEFPGGTPADLTMLITNQTRRPLNVIIPPEHADTQLPPLNLSSVTVPQLFDALAPASRKSSLRRSGGGYNISNTSYGFRTTGQAHPDSIWYFFVDAAPEVPPMTTADPGATVVCRFFQLGPYLDRGLKAQDITTAVETAWKMLDAGTAAKGFGEKPSPNLKFHQDTQLLIAVGAQARVDMITDVLSQLHSQNPTANRAPKTLPPPAPTFEHRDSQPPKP